MRKEHHIKLQSEYCYPVYYGDKNFEVRLNDRNYQKGDAVYFIPMYGDREIDHPIKSIIYLITYVHSGLGIEKGYVVFGIKQVDVVR